MDAADMPAGGAKTHTTAPGELAVPGELIYEYTPSVVRVVEYGSSADAVFSGRTMPPAEGARFDLYLDGPVNGPKLRGTLQGVDYVHFRADGRAELHIHAAVTTGDGTNVAVTAGGIAVRQGDTPVFQLREHVTLLTNHPELSWVNQVQIWASGTVDVSTGHVHVKGYAV
jgi:hypothetical protein